MAKNKGKSQVLGDDPLAWLNAGSTGDKKTVKNKTASKKKVSGKVKPKKEKAKKESKEKKVKAEVKAQPKVEPIANKESNRFVLESSLVINKASEVYDSLKKYSDTGKDVTIDASQVEIIDSAILQLFLSFVISLNESGVKLTWHQPTENLLNKASILGLTEKLGL